MTSCCSDNYDIPRARIADASYENDSKGKSRWTHRVKL